MPAGSRARSAHTIKLEESTKNACSAEGDTQYLVIMQRTGETRGGGGVETVAAAARATGGQSLVFGEEMKLESVTWTKDTIDNEHLGRKKSKSA